MRRSRLEGSFQGSRSRLETSGGPLTRAAQDEGKGWMDDGTENTGPQNRAVRNSRTFRPGSRISSFLNEVELRMSASSRLRPWTPRVISLAP